jgi:hypothetical protein
VGGARAVPCRRSFSSELAGPVGITSAVERTSSSPGFRFSLLHLLPLPYLDGGRLLWLLKERATGR